MSAAHNDYVLSTALEHQLINEEQQSAVGAMLTANPEFSALELLYEQQLINEAQRAWFYEALGLPVAQADAAPAPAKTRIEVVAKKEIEAKAPRDVDAFLQQGLTAGASDIHLGPEMIPLMRYQGRLVPLREGAEKFTPAETERLARNFLTAAQVEHVVNDGAVEFCYDVTGMARFRTSVVRQRRGWEMVFRIIASQVPSMDQLGLPEVLRTLTRYHNGLVLITGAVGSGKSTTLAAMIEQINVDRRDHIITLEDPIEYVFHPKGCQISQREVHSHTNSFAAALRASLREDPDVIMVGEMRDLETISLAITASETGHLVLGTLHTSTAPRTLDRLLDVFPIQQQAQIRTMVSESIRGIVCQQLLPRADGQGRVMAMEIMTHSPAVGALIRDGKTFMLPGVIQTGKKQGMRLMDDSLLDLLDQGLVTPEEAYHRSDNKKLFAQEMARRQQK